MSACASRSLGLGARQGLRERARHAHRCGRCAPPRWKDPALPPIARLPAHPGASRAATATAQVCPRLAVARTPPGPAPPAQARVLLSRPRRPARCARQSVRLESSPGSRTLAETGGAHRHPAHGLLLLLGAGLRSVRRSRERQLDHRSSPWRDPRSGGAAATGRSRWPAHPDRTEVPAKKTSPPPTTGRPLPAHRRRPILDPSIAPATVGRRPRSTAECRNDSGDEASVLPRRPLQGLPCERESHSLEPLQVA